MIINKNYTKLFFASMITRLGDSIDGIAFSWLVWTMTGRRDLMGGIFILSVLPNLIILPFSGVLADILNKRILVVVSDIMRGVFVATLALFYFFNILEVWHLFAFVFMNNIFESFASPARSGMLRSLIQDSELIKANSYLQSALSFGSLVGLGIAGALIGVIGISGAIIVDALTFFFSAILIYAISYHEENGIEKQSIKGYFGMIGDGFRFLKGKKLLISLLVLGAFINMTFTPFNILQPVYVTEVMNTGVYGLTLLGIAITAGMIVGGIVMGKIAHKIKPINAIGYGLGMMGFMYFLLGYIPNFNLSHNANIIVITVFVFLFTFHLPVMQAPVQGTMMKKIPKDMMGRIMSTMALFSLSAMPLGGAIVSIIGDSIPVTTLYIYMGLVIVVVCVSYWFINRNEEF